MNTRPQHGWLTSKFASALRQRQDRERELKRTEINVIHVSSIFPQQDVLRLSSKINKSHLEPQTKETTSDN